MYSLTYAGCKGLRIANYRENRFEQLLLPNFKANYSLFKFDAMVLRFPEGRLHASRLNDYVLMPKLFN